MNSCMQCTSINVFFVYHCGNRCCDTHIFGASPRARSGGVYPRQYGFFLFSYNLEIENQTLFRSA